MPTLPNPADLEALREFDSPTICNALELVVPARRAMGFTRRPLIAALLVIVGVIAVAPAVGYGLLIAALLIALWTSDRKRRQPRWPVSRER